MSCKHVKEYCSCPKTTCKFHGRCCDCILKHKNSDSLTHCLFENNNGDKSLENYYKYLKEKFEAK